MTAPRPGPPGRVDLSTHGEGARCPRLDGDADGVCRHVSEDIRDNVHVEPRQSEPESVRPNIKTVGGARVPR